MWWKWLIIYVLVVTVFLFILAFGQGDLSFDIKYWDKGAREGGAVVLGIFSLAYLVAYGLSKIA